MSIFKTLSKDRAMLVDLSHHNTGLDCHAMKAYGLSGVILKASEHLTADPAFAENRERDQSIDLLVLPYHFYRHHGDAGEQVKFFLDTIKPIKGLLLPAIDVELDDNERTMDPKDYFSGVLTWCQDFKATTGHAPLVPSYLSMWQWLGNPTALSKMGCSNWPASYGVTKPHLYGGWKTWMIWQVSDQDSVPGAGSSGVDSDLFNGNEATLRKRVLQ